MDRTRKTKYLWGGVAASMAVVAGFWGASVRRVLHQAAPSGNDAAFQEAYRELQENRDQFVKIFQQISASPSPRQGAATSTPPEVEALKQRVLDYGHR